MGPVLWLKRACSVEMGVARLGDCEKTGRGRLSGDGAVVWNFVPAYLVGVVVCIGRCGRSGALTHVLALLSVDVARASLFRICGLVVFMENMVKMQSWSFCRYGGSPMIRDEGPWGNDFWPLGSQGYLLQGFVHGNFVWMAVCLWLTKTRWSF